MQRYYKFVAGALVAFILLFWLLVSPLSAIPLGGKWLKDYEQALYLGRKKKLEVVAVFTYSWLKAGQQLEGETLADKEIRQLLDKSIKVYVDLNKRPELAQRFRGAELPAVIFYDAAGQELERTRGYLSPEMFKSEYARAHDPEANFPALAKKAAANREELALQEGLLNAYLTRHLIDEGLALVDELAALAPAGQEGWAGEMMLWRALFLERGKRWAEAIDLLNVFLVDYPLHALIEEGYFLKAKCAYLKGDSDLAKKTLNEFLNKFPFSPRVPEAQELIDYRYSPEEFRLSPSG